MQKGIIQTSLFLLPLVFIVCSNKETPVMTGIKTSTLHFSNQTEPQDLDPHIVTGIPEYHILQSLLEGLLTADPKDLHPIPGAASHWDISPDNLTYTFHLRNNGRWSNGDTVKAGDFLFSFKRILSPALASEYAYMLYCIDKAEDYHKSIIKDFSQVGISSPDDTTLVIRLGKPTPYFLSLVTHNSWYPVHPATILKFGNIDTRGTKWTRKENFVGNGAFKLTDWQINKIITVSKNQYYWDAASVRLEKINFYPIDNLLTEERAFRTGQVHVTTSLPLQKIEWYKANMPHFLKIDPYLATYYYILNVTKKPFDNKKVRQAFSMSINREEITKHVLKGGQIPAGSFTPINTSGYTFDQVLTFDTVTARNLLKEAGFNNTDQKFSASLLYNTSESHHTLAQAIQQMWKKHLGINISLVNQEWKVYLTSKNNREFDIARMGWVSDYNDPNSFLDLWVTNGGNNQTGWSNPQYDSLIEAASQAVDQSSRYDLFRKAEAILMDELPIIPIYFYTNIYLLHPSVKGWYPNILNIHNYKFLYLE